MNLLHPGLLWFLPIAGVPILLHLWSLRRPQRVELPTLRFLADSFQQQRRRHRLLDWLLATARALFLTSLIVAVSRPQSTSTLARTFADAGEVHVLVDVSASMRQRLRDGVCFERARDLARTVVDQASGRVRAYAVGTMLEPIDLGGESNGQARRMLEHLQCGQSVADWKSALDKLVLEIGEHGPATVVALSDFQATNWSAMAGKSPQSDAKPAAGNVRWLLAPCGPPQPLVNRSIHVAGTSSNIAAVGLPTPIDGFVRDPAAAGKAVAVRLADAEREIARANIQLDARGTGPLRFDYVPAKVGIAELTLTFANEIADGFPDDDAAGLSLYVRQPINVLIVTGKASADPLEDETFYLKAALGGQAFRVRQVQDFQLALSPLTEADVAIVANAGGLSDQQCLWLRDAVAEGMGLWFLPGDRVDAEATNTRFFAAHADRKELTALRLQPPAGDVQLAATHVSFGSWELARPALAPFQRHGASPFPTGRIFRHFPLRMAPALERQGDANEVFVLARLADRTPILAESRCGHGKIAIAGFSASSQWSNLPLRSDFPPFVSHLVRHLAEPFKLDAPSAVNVGQRVAVAASPRWTLAPARIAHATTSLAVDRNVEPQVTFREFDRDGERLRLSFDVAKVGAYRMSVDARSLRPRNVGIDPERGDFRGRSADASFFDAPPTTRLETGVAVNLDPTESDFQVVDWTQLRNALGADRTQIAEPAAWSQGLQWNGDATTASDFGEALLWLAAMLLAFEVWLSGRASK